MTVGVLLAMVCIVLSLGAMLGALIYFNVRERRESRQTENASGDHQGRGGNQQRSDHQ
ncbi:MAG: hypothetical protein OXI70_05950 [Chloroflexota bacterium]|nr:hypothetical protein [Chloroflexota bacterium]